jgi:hypothetical protein
MSTVPDVPPAGKPTRIMTTLYDLITALQDVYGQDNGSVVLTTVVLMRNGLLRRAPHPTPRQAPRLP